MFIPMLIAFFHAHTICGISQSQKAILRICMIASCAVLYVGAMWVMPSDGKTMSSENVWHGILSFGGMLMIFLTYCLYTFFIRRKDRDGALLLVGFLVFSLITGVFAVLNVFDDKSYVDRFGCLRIVRADHDEPDRLSDILSRISKSKVELKNETGLRF